MRRRWRGEFCACADAVLVLTFVLRLPVQDSRKYPMAATCLTPRHASKPSATSSLRPKLLANPAVRPKRRISCVSLHFSKHQHPMWIFGLPLAAYMANNATLASQPFYFSIQLATQWFLVFSCYPLQYSLYLWGMPLHLHLDNRDRVGIRWMEN